VQPAPSRNVVGMLEGSDPQLCQEAVVMGAHMDHLGLQGGVLHPGADDNASGVSALMEIAKALAASPVRPRRSLVFVFWTAEEAGQDGSFYYVRHPLWPLERTVAYLNLDMIAHPWTAEEIRALVAAADPGEAAPLLARATPANFAEPGLAQWAPGLADALGAAARGTGMVLHLDRGDGRNGGSDYRAFARRGLPWIRFFGNFFPGYHEPEDTPDQIDPGQVQRMARLAFATAWLLADREAARP
jgi:Zn-dependent M28 family amino/carboxypeptidase